MKRILSFALTVFMLASLVACGTPQSAPQAAGAPASESTQSTQEPEPTPEPMYGDEELARAVERGFGEYREGDPAVTYPEFFAMLDRAVELIDSTRLAEWQALLPEARAATNEINRGNAMLAVFSLAEFLGGDYWRYTEETNGLWDVPKPWETDEWRIDGYWGDTMRFPAGFDGITEPNGWNFGGTAYYYSMGCASMDSAQPIFDFDAEHQSMRCADALTYEEALLAALRFTESEPAGAQGLFVPSDSAEARTAALAGDTLELAASLPDASWNSLPAWYGVTLNSTEFSGSSGVRPPWYEEQDIVDVASFGFNFIRVPLDASLYFVGEEQTYIRTKRLANMDALIDWAATSGVHICLDLHNCQGSTTDGNNENDTLWTDKTQQERFVAVWDLLAERYKDVPNGLLSFNLVNEPNTDNLKAYVSLMRRAIEAIRVHSPERLIFVDMHNGSQTPIYELAADHVAQSFHCYNPTAFANAFRNYPDGEAVAASWPMYLSKTTIGRKQPAFSMSGSFPAGAEVSFCVRAVQLTGTLRLMANGTEVFSQTFDKPAVGEEHCSFIGEEGTNGEYRQYTGNRFTVILPQAAEKLEFTIDGASGWMNLDQLVLTVGETQIMIGEHYDKSLLPRGKNMSDMPNPQLTIAADGTVSCENDVFFTVCDGKYLKTLLAQYRAFSEETGVAVMMQEFAIYNTMPYAPTLAFLDDLLSAANEYGLNWCSWDYYGHFNFLATQDDELREGATYEDLHGDGQVATELLAVLQKHMTRYVKHS